MGEVIEENDLGRHIRYGHKIVDASWSSETSLWTVQVEKKDGTTQTFTTNFLWMCQGYYRHDVGYTPDWPGMADFKGRIVHPQTWPEDLDYTGMKVVVIGSGATAATVAPALTQKAGHVTVLQRSPTYFAPGRNAVELADQLRELKVDEAWIHEITRRKLLHDGEIFTKRTFDEPEAVREELLEMARQFLGADTVAKHFTPKYRPWQQRVAYIPDGDLFVGVATGKVTMVTDEIDHFTATGIVTKGGETIEADIVVTATGFHLSVLGDIPFTVDGKRIDWADTITFRGMMFTGVPNLIWVFGYFRAAWTLRADMVADFVVRLLNHMHDKGVSKVEVALRPEDKDMPILPWIDPENFNPGYLLRDMHKLPKRGDKRDWQHTQDYYNEKDEFPAIDLDDVAFVYGQARNRAAAA